MRILIEAHHPAHVHFWKFPVRELQEHGHEVRVLGRDRDVMRQLFESYDWIPASIPRTGSGRLNRFPLPDMILRQIAMLREIRKFQPEVVASLMGSYSQFARLTGCRSVIFTDSEFQHFNHRIAHPFAHEIHTPYCFYKKLGPKQRVYKGIHELCFLDGRRFQADREVLAKYPKLGNSRYMVLRLSAWNTFHDIGHRGTGPEILGLIESVQDTHRVVISAEEGNLPDELKSHVMNFRPEDFHHILAFADFVLTEGASTASEAACLGTPAVCINSTEPRGYLRMLEREYGLARTFQDSQKGIEFAIGWLKSIGEKEREAFRKSRDKLLSDHCDVCQYVVGVLEGNNRQ